MIKLEQIEFGKSIDQDEQTSLFEQIKQSSDKKVKKSSAQSMVVSKSRKQSNFSSLKSHKSHISSRVITANAHP